MYFLLMIIIVFITSSNVMGKDGDNKALEYTEIVCVKIHFSSMLFSNWKNSFGSSISIEYFPVSFISLGLFNILQISENKDLNCYRYQWISSFNIRFYKRIGESRFKMGPHIGLGNICRWDKKLLDNKNCFAIFGGMGFLFYITEKIALTGTILPYYTTIPEDNFIVTTNIGVHLAIY